jgi:hypothetical protein
MMANLTIRAAAAGRVQDDLVNKVAEVVYATIRAYGDVNGGRLPCWEEAPRQRRDGVIAAVRAIAAGTVRSAAELHALDGFGATALRPFCDLPPDERRRYRLFWRVANALLESDANDPPALA